MIFGLLVFTLVNAATTLWERALRPRSGNVPEPDRERTHAIRAGMSGFGVILFATLSYSTAAENKVVFGVFTGAAAVATGLFVFSWSRALRARR